MASQNSKKLNVVILGAGTGGLSLARCLDQYMEKNANAMRVLIVDRNHSTLSETALPFVLSGKARADTDGVTSFYADAQLQNVAFIFDEIVHINVEKKTIVCKNRRVRYDRLIINLGADIDRDMGLESAGQNILDVNHIVQLKDALQDFRGGKILVCDVPNAKSPASAYSIALLIRSIIRHSKTGSKAARAQISANTDITLTTPELWPAVAKDSLNAIAIERDVLVKPGLTPLLAQPDYKKDSIGGTVIFKNGEKESYDILVTHVPKKPLKLLVESKLCSPDRFIPTNAATSRTHFKHVYCMGDAAEMTIPYTDMPFPRHHAFSVSAASTIAADIIQSLRSEAPTWRAEDGIRNRDKVQIYAEVGENQSISIDCDLFAHSQPTDPRNLFNVSKPDNRLTKSLIKGWDDLMKNLFIRGDVDDAGKKQ